MSPFHHRSRSRRAFSLIEVTMAVGIAAVGILTLVALVPFGLDSLKSSAGHASEAKMIQTIVSDFQMVDWVKGPTGMKPPDKEYYFAQHGIEVEKGTFDHLYTAQVSVEDASPTMPGDTSSNVYLRRLVIRVLNRDGRTSRHETTLAFFDQTGVREVLP